MSFLTIYIPSYRRPRSLVKQVSILLQAAVDGCLINDDIEIIVNLNGSEENLYSMTELSLLHDPLKILSVRSNLSNIGGNANILAGYHNGDPCGYLWILSDNDIVCPLTLVKVLENLRAHNPDILLLDSDSEQNFSLNCYQSLCWNDSPLNAAGLISRAIYRTQYISRSIEAGYIYHNSSFPHIAILLDSYLINQRCNISTLLKPCFEQQAHLDDEYVGDYSMSYAGRLLLSTLLPPKARCNYLRRTISDSPLSFYSAYKKYPLIVISSLFQVLTISPMLLILLPLYLIIDLLKRGYRSF